MRWEDVVRVALLGTERAQLPPLDDSQEIDAVLAALGEERAERRVLAAAGLLWQARRAGRPPRPRPDVPRTPVAPPPSRPFLGPRAAAVIDRLLAGEEALLAAWLEAVARAGRSVPPRALVTLLRLGSRDEAMQARILPVLGERGAWLASFDPELDWAAGTGDPQEVWQHGKGAARLALLRRLRRDDAARARDLVRATWTEDGGETRAAFLEAFAVGLSMDDEPFLEEALDDRRREVRQAAATLLMRLAPSRLAGRMAARLDRLLTLDVDTSSRLPAHLQGRQALVVALPEACDAGMQRDGIEPKVRPSFRGLGERTWWFVQLLRATPPSHLVDRFGLSAAALMRVAAGSEWGQLLVEGLRGAAIAYRDADMVRASVQAHEAGVPMTPPQPVLYEVLPPAEREALALAALRPPLRDGHPAIARVAACSFPWSVALGRAFFTAIRATASVGPHGTEEARGLLPDAALHFPLALADAAGLGWPPTQPLPARAWLNAYDGFLGQLRLRADAWAVLDEDAAESAMGRSSP